MTVAVLVTLGVTWLRPATSPASAGRAMRFAFVPPENLTVEDVGSDDIIVSPDGTKLVFTARAGEGRRQLWVRSLDALDARALPDTADAIEPFWSPDSLSIGFAAAGKLKRVDIAGGRAQTLADAARLNGGSSWSPAGVIVFSPDFGKGLFQVQASGGGRASKLREPGTAPCFLPDGRHVMYNKGASIVVGSLDSPDDVPLSGVQNRVFYAANPAGNPKLPGGATGWLVFVRSAELVAQAFDAGRLALVGEAARVPTEAVASAGLTEARRFVSVSDTGVLVLITSQARSYQLRWVDRAGKQLGTLGPATRSTVASQPSISPDGNRVVMQWTDPKIGSQNIWVEDLARGTRDRVTTRRSQLPIWSADGRRIFFSTSKDGVGGSGIYQAATAGGDEHLVLKGVVFASGASPDGRVLIYYQRGQSTRMDVWALPVAGDPSSTAAARPAYPLLNSEFDEAGAQLSPDGRWLAYASDVTGTEEVYVRRFNTDDGKVGEPVQISTGSGTRPRWRPDGTELFYLASPDAGIRAQMMAVTVKAGGATLEGRPTALFTTRMLPSTLFTDYDVTRDGQRFLVGTIIDEPNVARPSAIVVINWMAELKK